ncbi:MAG: histidine kinase [Halioglobus sp.]|nr:histidine kinase [Halioglobus sp.]
MLSLKSLQQEPKKEAGLREFFIPDLCAARPVLLSILLSELLVLVYVLASSGVLGFDWDQFALCSLFVLWVVLLSSMLLCRSRRVLSSFSLPLVALSSLLLVSLVTLGTSLIAQVAFSHAAIIPGDAWWVLRNLLVSNVLAGIVLRYFYLQQQLRLQQELELEARLDSLRTRIRPHFLFNTLNSIASLIMSNPQTAEEAVEDLAELFRASLKESRQTTTVQDEIDLTRIYLGIEKLRLGQRLQVKWEVDDNALEVSMPTLVLQPLVENAVYHGISRLSSGGCIEINIGLRSEALVASVGNPLPEDGYVSEGNRIGLDNVRQRLQAMYGPGASLEARRSKGYFNIEITYMPPSKLVK